MAGERRLRILNRLVGDAAPELETRRLCEVCAEVTDMTGAGLMLMSGDVPRGSVCTTNEVSAHIEQWRDAFGEGPCVWMRIGNLVPYSNQTSRILPRFDGWPLLRRL